MTTTTIAKINDNNNKQRIFAYLRKSTKKAQQEQSIEKQKNAIKVFSVGLNIDFKDIEFFIDEGYSGFNGIVHTTKNKYTRQRKDFTRLIDSIRKVKVPCTVLVYDYSRLTRNIEDYTEIAKLLGINNKNGIKIEGVYFTDGNVWNKYTKQGDMIGNVLDSLKYSEKISDNIIGARELRLKDGLFPNDIRLPKGLEKGEKYLKLSNDMPFIKKAFEKKAEGNSNKDIIKYLKKNNISISLSHIADRLWKNRLYVGEYTLKATGEVFTVKFHQNKKPISLKLFNEASNNIGLKKGKYGKKQINDLISSLLKTDSGKKFTMYIPKGKNSKQYLNNMEKSYISQRKIFDEFGEIINRIFFLLAKITLKYIVEKTLINSDELFESEEFKWFSKERLVYEKDFIEKTKEINFISDLGYTKDFKLNSAIINNFFKEFYILQKLNRIGFENVYNNYATEEEKEKLLKLFNVLSKEELIKVIKEDFEFKLYVISTLKEMLMQNGSQEFKIQEKEDEETIKDLEKMKLKLEEIIQQAKNNGILNGFTKDDIKEATKKPLEEIENINEEINEIKNNSLNGKDLDKFTEAISKIFEHTSNMLGQANGVVKEEDYLYLIKLITFELVFDNKKELKIKLFKGVEKLLFAIGTPKENRTPVWTVRGSRPRPLDDGSKKYKS